MIRPLWYLIVVALCLSNCQNPVQNTTERITSLTALKTYVSETDNPICGLELLDITPQAPTLLKEDLKDFLAYTPAETATQPEDAAAIKKFFRRAALRRRLNVDGPLNTLAAQFYTELYAGEPIAKDLDSHYHRLEFWDNHYQKQNDYASADSVEYNIRFCVINEARAQAISDMRSWMNKESDAGRLRIGSTLIELLTLDQFYSQNFKTQIITQLIKNDTSILPLDMAWLHSPSTPILPSDPKTAEMFWAARDAEIEAIFAYIETADYTSNADKLKDMRHIDQTIRGIFSVTHLGSSHFDSETELDLLKKGIGQRMIKVDRFNTKHLKTMIEGREWLRDDIDGPGAANTGWLMAQHADQDPEFQKEVLKKMEAALGNPGVSKSNYAYLIDRTMASWGREDTSAKRTQRYGTQGRCRPNGKWEPLTLEDPDNINVLRAEMDLGPIEDYIARFQCPKPDK